MSFFNVSSKAEDVKQGGSNYINNSGLFPITIIVPIVSVNEKGSETVDLFVEYEGQKQIIYGGLRITNNDGTPNTIGAKVFNQLGIIAGLKVIEDPTEAELPIGKKESMKDCAVLEQLADMNVIVRIQMEYSEWNGDIKEKKSIKAFFSENKVSAEEIVNNSETTGVTYTKEEKYKNNITFKDGLTAETIEEWIKADRPSGTAKGGSTATKKPEFTKKRFGKS